MPHATIPTLAHGSGLRLEASHDATEWVYHDRVLELSDGHETPVKQSLDVRFPVTSAALCELCGTFRRHVIIPHLATDPPILCPTCEVCRFNASHATGDPYYLWTPRPNVYHYPDPPGDS